MKRRLSLAAAVALLVGGASSATAQESSSPPATLPGTPPSRIISLSPSSTETLFAIGAGPQVVAVDEYSNFPAETQQLPHDLSGYTPNVEAIAALRPDLVIHDGTTDLHQQLADLNIADMVAAAPADIPGVFDQIEQLGAATGHVADSARLVASMSTQINLILGRPVSAPITASTTPGPMPGSVPGSAPATSSGPTYFHELDNTLYTMTSKTFIGAVYTMFGLVNIADASSPDNPYPQLSAETVITANPQLIFLADGGLGESPETVAARPGWSAISAVRNGNIIVLDANIASRWGPRVVDLVRAIAEATNKVTTSATTGG